MFRPFFRVGMFYAVRKSNNYLPISNRLFIRLIALAPKYPQKA